MYLPWFAIENILSETLKRFNLSTTTEVLERLLPILGGWVGVGTGPPRIQALVKWKPKGTWKEIQSMWRFKSSPFESLHYLLGLGEKT